MPLTTVLCCSSQYTTLQYSGNTQQYNYLPYLASALAYEHLNTETVGKWRAMKGGKWVRGETQIITQSLTMTYTDQLVALNKHMILFRIYMEIVN